MTSVSYALALQGPDGSILSGTLTFPSALSTDKQASPQPTAGERIWVYVEPLAGSLVAPDLIGPEPLPLTGIIFVSALGPTISFVLGGDRAKASVSLQFNVIDSPGQYFGGGLGYFPEGSGSPVIPYSVIGVLEG